MAATNPTDIKKFAQFLKSIGSNNQTKEEFTLLKNIEQSNSPTSTLSKSFNRKNGPNPSAQHFEKLVEILLTKNPTYVSQQDPSNGFTMLHYASHLGFTSLVEYLLSKGASTGTEDFSGSPPLAYAEKGGHDATVSVLLRRQTLSSKAEEQSLDSVKEIQRIKDIIESCDILGLELALKKRQVINCEDRAGSTLLHVAAYLGNVEAVNLLIQFGANVNSVDNENNSSLHKSVSGGHIDTVKLLIQRGIDVTARNNDGLTALHHGCSAGLLDMVQLLVSAGSDLNARDNEGTTPLHHAVTSGSVDIVKILLSGKTANYTAPRPADPNIGDNKQMTPFHIAAIENQVEIGKILIQSKANINVADIEGCTPLHHCSSLGHLDYLELLLSQKSINSSLNEYDLSGSTPLHKACFYGHSAVAELLIKSGAIVDTQNGYTSPLHSAAFSGHAHCINLLLKKGANVNCVDHEKATPLHKGAFMGQMEVVRELLKRGADMHAHDDEGSTPLHKAAFSGRSDVIEILLSAGAEVDAQDNDDGTPLHNACFNGHLESVKLLLGSQANINGADAKGASPLHLAVLNGHLPVASYLVENGAPIDAPDDRGMMGLHFGIAHPSCLAYLVEQGADPSSHDNFGRTALFYAAKNSCEDSCRFLVSKGVDLYEKDNSGKSPFDVASPSFQKVLLLALKERESQIDSETQKKYQQAGKLFNVKPQKGIDYLVQNKICAGKPDEIARFLHTTTTLQKKQIGDYIGEGDMFNIQVMKEFIDQMDFTGLDFDDAIRHFLSKFNLPGEAQKIDRLMEKFASRFCDNNPGIFSHQDTAYILAFSLIMLNTDAHSSQVKNKMSKDQFLRANKPIMSELSTEFLSEMYDKIVNNEIKMNCDSSIFTSAEKKGWAHKQGGRIRSWKKRWFVLKDNCLYYFKNQDDHQPCGIVPLENIQVRSVTVKGHKNVFELLSIDGEIKACKLSNGQLVKGHHGSYLISAPTQEEMDSWIAAISNNIAFNPLFEMINLKISSHKSNSNANKHNSYVGVSPSSSSLSLSASASSGSLPSSRRTSLADEGSSYDFNELYEACLMCSIGYKSVNAIKEAYGNMVSMIVDDDVAFPVSPKSSVGFNGNARASLNSYNLNPSGNKYFMLTNERAKIQTIVLCGAFTESSLSSVLSASAVAPSSTDVLRTLQLDKSAEQIDRSMVKLLKKEKDYQIDIIGHSIGGALAILFAMHLLKEGYKIRKVVTFGQPKILKSKDLSDCKNLSILRVVDHNDPIPPLFDGYLHTGPGLILLDDNYYSTLSEDAVMSEENGHKKKLDNNHVESYLRNIKNKQKKTPFFTLWTERMKTKN